MASLLKPLLWLLLSTLVASEAEPNLQTYIIHMDHSKKPETFPTHESWHRSTLESLPYGSSDKLLYSYNHVMHGFSAQLTKSQLSQLETSSAHVATYKESFGKLYTTHSSKFLGLKRNSGIWPKSSFGKDVIIGVIDSGVWPESASFNDKGMPRVPLRWKGECESGVGFSMSLCNRKLIGARSFKKGHVAAGRKVLEIEYDSARDSIGHGTHTSSTAAGAAVLGASHFGYASGLARGVAPAAHVAMYKVVWAAETDESAASDVLAGMDKAIEDGVDIMSLSLGFDQTPYFDDVIAIASLSAIEKGITVVCATGNDMSYNSTHNSAPWIITVGAGTMDRSFIASVAFGNGLTVKGTSYFPESVYIADALIYHGGDNKTKASCEYLDPNEVVGKVVLCDSSLNPDSQFDVVENVGAIAGIFISDALIMDPEDYSIPSVLLPTSSGPGVMQYMNVTDNATVTMRFVQTEVGKSTRAPQIAYFTSRGPDPINPNLLKPDIIAPGVDILAAVPPNLPFMEVGSYSMVTDYALYSGTSMAAPHVAGVAALLKGVHPDWNPTKIRSAIMTTAYTIDNTGTVFLNPILGQPESQAATPLDFGSGHVDPNKAMDPGLVYDLDSQDYIDFLCGLGYSDKQMSAVLRRSEWNCTVEKHGDLNYPSFMGVFHAGDIRAKNFSRVVTNVGPDSAVYQASIEVREGMKISVDPTSLTFNQKNQKQRFELMIEVDEQFSGVTYGFLRWVDQYNHVVSSPIMAVSY